MNIIILGNFPTREICKEIGIEAGNKEGWIESYLELLSENNSIYYVFPQKTEKDIIRGKYSNINYIGYVRKEKPEWRYSKGLEKKFIEILREINDIDIIHIMGTEYGHTLAMVNSLQRMEILEKGVISIQGIMSICAEVYLEGIPFLVSNRWCYGDILKKSNLTISKIFFGLRGENERKALLKIKNVIGRTDLDKAFTKTINSKVNYFYCREALRNIFYEKYWNFEKCEKDTIFISQGNYPIKGFHYFIEALAIVKEEIPNVMVRITGKNVLKCRKLTSYERYIKDLLIKTKCQDSVKFLGNLTAEQMAEEYIKANIFVSPSIVENSSNSIGEAMLIGTPILASNVGGTNSIINHKKNGILYEYDSIYLLSYYIVFLLKNCEIATELSINERKKAEKIYSREEIKSELLDIYKSISNCYS